VPALLSALGSRLKRARQITVWLPRAVQSAIAKQVAGAEPDETGGILLGYEALAAGAVVVTHLVGPGPKSKATRARFDPDGEWQEKEVARIYEETGRHSTYLGDWHSHPRGLARLSRKDRRTARSIAEHEEARMPNPLMLIVATSDTSFRFAAFRYSRRKLRRVAVHPYDDAHLTRQRSLVAKSPNA
jgi:integrative and conjugative element protein (TIGR02256 family)